MVAPALIAGAVAAPIVGGLIGRDQASGDRARAKSAMKNALAQFDGIETPDLAPINFADYQYLGDYDPTMEGMVDLGPSAFEGIALDPVTREAQMRALMQMQEIADQGGMTATDKARLGDMQSQVGQQMRGNREAIEQNMRARGISGSGLELLNQQMNAQSGADRASREALNIEAMAEQRALEAMQNAAAMGGQIRGQDYQQASDKAKAMDIINQFNASNRQGVMGRNTDRTNTAGMAGWDARQNIGNANTDNTNKALMHNQYTIPQSNFDNKTQLASGKAGAYGAASNYYGQNAQNTQQMWSGIGSGIGQGMAAYGANQKKG